LQQLDISAKLVTFAAQMNIFIFLSFFGEISVIPPINDFGETVTIHITLADIFTSLKTTVLGTSSVLYAWNPASETFHPLGGDTDGRRRVIVIEGKDAVMSERYVCVLSTSQSSHNFYFF
jgi:hypothetical protein